MGLARIDVPADRAVVVEIEDPKDGLVLRQQVVTPPEGARETLTFDFGRVQSARSLTFEVVSIPPGGRLFALADARSGRGRLMARGRSDEAGFITLPWQTGGSKYSFQAPGYCGWSRSFSERPPGDPVIRVEMVQHASVLGVLSPGRAKPTRPGSVGPTIRLRRKDAPPVLDPWFEPAEPDQPGTWQIEITDFETANHVLHGVSVLVDHGTTSRVLATGLTIHPGDRIEVVDPFEGAPGFELVVLGKDSRRWTTRLDLSFVPSGAPDDDPWLRSVVQDDGEVDVHRLPLGTWDVYAGRWTERKVAIPLATIKHDGTAVQRLDLANYVPVFGRVDRSDGTPMKAARLVLRTGTETRTTLAGNDGTFDLSVVKAGTSSSIEVSHPLGEVSRKQIESDPEWALQQRKGGLTLRVELIATGDSITIAPW
ncbi:MAG: hypothetical protein AAF957_07690 [Planctomycetota bacterium]